jgi:cell division protein FtsL
MVRRKLQKRELAAAAAFLLLLVGTLTFYVWHQAALVNLGFEASKLQERITLLKEKIEQLETSKAQLLAPQRVERIARDELHLIEPAPEQIIYGNHGRSDHR